jgi:hypothetical protein
MADYSAVDYLVAENSVEGYLVDLWSFLLRRHQQLPGRTHQKA